MLDFSYREVYHCIRLDDYGSSVARAWCVFAARLCLSTRVSLGADGRWHLQKGPRRHIVHLVKGREMSMQVSNHSHCLRTFRNPIQARRRRCTGTRASGILLIFLLSASLAYGAGPVGTPTPPPAPRVPPIISGDYAGDLNGNRINDALEFGIGGISIASAEMVEVELIFNEPVTQRQMDEFLRLGGQITYVYQAVSFGWNGLISRPNISLLPSAMGPALVRVEAVQQIQYYMDTSTQVGRVRPIWKAGFAGIANGFRGDPNTTIGLLGGGVDAAHADLRGRNVYWIDFTVDNEPAPVDYDGHDTLVAGIAVGTGVAGGADDRELRFTYTFYDPYYLTWGHQTDPITLPARQITMKSSAWWSPGQTCIIDQYRWTRGTDGATSTKEAGNYIRSKSPGVLTNTFMGSTNDIFATVLMDYDTRKPVENVTIVTSINPYPGVGDGFNKFSGVAPGCKWAAVKVFDRDGNASSSGMTKGLDEFVKKSVEKNIKIVNISVGYSILGIPSENTSVRDKVNTMVNNGIIVVAAAGNGANDSFELFRKMADPARASMAITVGASNDENTLTAYSNYGFIMPRTNVGEDFKPDVIAPGGSYLYTGMMSGDSGTSDGLGMDKEPNDYASGVGTSFSAPFVSGCAALVINAMEAQGTKWTFGSSNQPRYVKMLLCATASETNAQRENKQFNPTLSRAAAGPEGYPAGKDQQEGYGLINPDAAVEAVCQTYAMGSVATGDLGGNSAAKRVWARTVNLKAGCDITVSLTNPAGADFDLYLYSAVPSNTGTPVLLASSTLTKSGDPESLQYSPTADGPALLVVKRVSGAGTFSLNSTQAGPPTAADVQANCAFNGSTTITLKATDDGKPTPPGAISYTILSKPAQGKLELTNGTAITNVPAKLPADKVVYRPNADYLGQDSFTFNADDGGTAPFGGQSNTATVKITVVKEMTVEYQVMASADDAFSSKGSTTQGLTDKWLGVGMHLAGMRFNNVKIPQGSSIIRATLKICPHSAGLEAEVDGVVKGEASDNAAAFATTSRIIGQLAATTASKAWKWVGPEDDPWTANAWVESPDIKAVVQEIVNRSGWAPDNSLAIIYTFNQMTFGDERRFYSFDGDPLKAAKLAITYQPK